MIEIGSDHWHWHVDQIATIYTDAARAAAGWAEPMDTETLLEIRRRAFVGADQFQGSQEAWDAAIGAARTRVKVVPLAHRKGR